MLAVLERARPRTCRAPWLGLGQDAGWAPAWSLIRGHAGGEPAGLGGLRGGGPGREPDHVSAYSLIIEDGTELAAQCRGRYRARTRTTGGQGPRSRTGCCGTRASPGRGLPTGRGTRTVARRSRTAAHNITYWRDQDWWALGPGARSHVDGVRWWSLKRPLPYTNRRGARGVSPAAGRERWMGEPSSWSARDRRPDREGIPVACAAVQGRRAVAAHRGRLTRRPRRARPAGGARRCGPSHGRAP
ncbi:hypothetical protein QJS66_03695 [Kocuria rhizophila]|nr:hypothetical protein QJS66_03695 [Kocuria rhizophila]